MIFGCFQFWGCCYDEMRICHTNCRSLILYCLTGTIAGDFLKPETIIDDRVVD